MFVHANPQYGAYRNPEMIQATGNMIAPMWFQIAGVVANFVFDPILIFGIGIFPAMESAVLRWLLLRAICCP